LTLDESEFYSNAPKKSKPDYIYTSLECKKCWGKASRKFRAGRRLGHKQKAVDLLGGKCQNCGYNKNLYALEFHHINPEEKDAQLSNLFTRAGWDKIHKEVIKCKLLCSNCHKEHHYPEGNLNEMR
jgi:5-methylcytosine-specific restriction endonuclease McrA